MGINKDTYALPILKKVLALSEWMANSGVSMSVRSGAAGGPARMGIRGLEMDSGRAGGPAMNEEDGAGAGAGTEVMEMTGAGGPTGRRGTETKESGLAAYPYP
jgi:hypothetical protein